MLKGALRDGRSSLKVLGSKSLTEEWNILGFREIRCGIHRWAKQETWVGERSWLACWTYMLGVS